MQEQHLFEYAVIRVVPRVEREEFLNVGVVLYCAGQKFLSCRYIVDEAKLKAFGCEPDCEQLKQYLSAMQRICAGSPDSGPIGKLGIAERFRWLTAIRSTIVQTSRVHTGFCHNAGDELAKLFEQLVM
ncbi:DUF3037 domain-containing protein [Polluticoccus soli]|uniref:DUF3037 domain-containing protein n=1 Tax=Polluticoccus soli TaxID=3034150 RepID=UPI0023E2215F|nr:DUF3037 domain-containing protein [Flavipsychrobacter sp. JY13-12]